MKQRRHFSQRTVSLFLSLLMILLCIPYSAVADEIISPAGNMEQNISEEQPSPIDAESQFNAFQMGIGEKSVAELQTMRVEDLARPETVSLAVAREKGHIHRLSEQEDDLQTVIFQNLSGTKTTYVYSRPVKYIENGIVKDKSSILGASSLPGYAYAMENNSTKVYFAPLATGGVRVTYEDYALIMKPATSLLVSAASVGEDENTVLYNGAFGARTVLRYQTTLYGVKEDIILTTNVGKYAFQFQVVAENLAPLQIGEDWYFQNEEGDRVISLGRIVVKDSDGKKVYGNMNITPTSQANVYLLTINVPQAFLQASDTVYPVYIDPTTTVNETGYYYTYDGNDVVLDEYQAITDLGLYTDALYYDVAESIPGAHILSDGKGQVAYKFYDFYASNGLFSSLQYWQIINATLKFYTVCNSSFSITAYPMTTSWSEDTFLLNSPLSNSYNSWATVASMVGIAGDNIQQSFNITDYAIDWTLFNHWGEESDYLDPNEGFMLVQTNVGEDIFISSVEGETNNVCLEVETLPFEGEYFIKNRSTGYLLKNTGNTGVVLGNHTSYKRIEGWIIENCGREDSRYVIRSLINPNYALVGGTAPTLAAVPTSGFTDEYLWYITEVANGGFVIQNYESGKYLYYNGSALDMSISVPPISSSTYSQYLWDLMLRSRYNEMEDFRIANETWLAVGVSTAFRVLHDYGVFCWADSSDFTWASSDTAVVTVDQSGNVTVVGNGIAKITATNKISGVSRSYQVRINPTNYLENKGVELFLQSQNLTNGSMVKRKELDSTEQTRWIITHDNNGYFLIRSEYSNMYLCVQNNSSANGAAIVQVPTPTIGCYWRIENTFEYADDLSYDYSYKISSQCGNGYVLHTSPYMTTCNQATYTADDNYDDAWVITPALYGSRAFWTFDEDPNQRSSLNCEGYAMGVVAYPTYYFDNSLYKDLPFEEAVLEFESHVNCIFTSDMLGYNITYRFEGVNLQDDQLAPLDINEYRVVLRTGLYPLEEPSDDGIMFDYGYHFWYQTYDGRWAHKNGTMTEILLHSQCTPNFPGNGWDRPAYNGKEAIGDYYNSSIYYYILEIS